MKETAVFSPYIYLQELSQDSMADAVTALEGEWVELHLLCLGSSPKNQVGKCIAYQIFCGRKIFFGYSLVRTAFDMLWLEVLAKLSASRASLLAPAPGAVWR